MFAGEGKRRILAVVWILAFLILLITFNCSFDAEEMRTRLGRIEDEITAEDWTRAEEDTASFVNIFKAKRYFIQMNNSTEIYTTFEHTVSQLELAVKNEQESALEYAGLLKAAIDFTLKPFSGP